MHGLSWLDSPVYVPGDEESAHECIQFIDKFITCSRVVEDDMRDILQYQVHKHSNTCHKKVGKNKCRFGFPKPPLPETMILEPLPPTASSIQKEIAKETWKRIEKELNTRGRNPEDNQSFEDFLLQLDITQENYITGKFVRT